jgi:hypothetical protein
MMAMVAEGYDLDYAGRAVLAWELEVDTRAVPGSGTLRT